MPGARDIVNTGTFFSQFLADNFENCSEERLDAFMSEIMENTQDFLPNIKNSLVAQITVEDCSQPPDAEILNRAANLFLCGCSSCWFIRENMNLKVVKPYPEVIYHVLGKDDVQDGMSGWSAQKISVDPLVLQAGRDILEVLGLSPNTMRDEVAKLGKLECRCGHHAYSDVALTFEQLVRMVDFIGVLNPNISYIGRAYISRTKMERTHGKKDRRKIVGVSGTFQMSHIDDSTVYFLPRILRTLKQTSQGRIASRRPFPRSPQNFGRNRSLWHGCI